MGSKNFSLLFLLLVFSLFSCSDQAPRLAVVFPQVIYDVEEEVFSFSVYGTFSSEENRIDRMEIRHLNSKMLWNCNNLEMIYSKDKKTKYVGYSAFYPPETGFPAGEYEIIFYDGLNRFEKYLFTMQKELKKENYNNLKKTEKYIGIYDQDNILLYAGKKEDKQSSVSKIKKNYPKAVYYRNMIKSKETSILYILEKQNIE